MAALVDVSSPARVSPGSGTVATTAAFDPPISLLVACVNADAGGATAAAVTTNGTALTWTTVGERQPGDAGSQGGYAGLFAAQLDAGRTGMTVTATLSGGGANPSLKVYVVTGAGAGAVADAIGDSAEGSSVAEVTTTTAITTNADVGNLVFCVASDFDNTGEPSSTDLTEDAFDIGGLDGLSGFKTPTTASTTCNLTAGGGSPAWNYVLVEVLANAKTATLIEDFTAGLPASMTSFGNVTFSAGGVEAETIAAFSGVETLGLYDLTGSQVITQMTEVPDAGTGTTQALLNLRHDAANQIRIGFQDGQLRGSHVIDGPTFTDVFAVTYNTGSHDWLRISESGGVVEFATATDGVTWVAAATFSTTTLTSPINAYQVQLTSGYFGEETPPVGNGRWEHINVTPRVELGGTAAAAATAFGELEVIRSLSGRADAAAAASADLGVIRDLSGRADAAAAAFGDIVVDTPVFLEGHGSAAAAAFGNLTAEIGLSGRAAAAAAAFADLTVILGPRDVTVTVGATRLGLEAGDNRIDRGP